MREYVPKWIGKESYRIIIAVIKQYPNLKNKKYLKRLETLKIKSVCDAYEKFDKFEKELICDRFWKEKAYFEIDAPFCDSDKQRIVKNFIIEVGKNLGEI